MCSTNLLNRSSAMVMIGWLIRNLALYSATCKMFPLIHSKH